MSVNASIDQAVSNERRVGPIKFSVVVVLLFFTAFFVGGATISENATWSTGLVNIVTVVAFVGAMLTVAFSMIGMPRRFH